MRALVQRVTQADVHVRPTDGAPLEPAGTIGAGLVVFVGVTVSDTAASAQRLAAKVANLRIFDDAQGVANLSLLDIGGEALVVSQFTLYADTRKGRRPSYLGAARPEQAEPLVEAVTSALAALGVRTASGRFQTHMQVALVNDGPMTFLIEV
ncbi:MAG: D-tyrosyl-tRNA(Tyr) deacylase [Glaciecola sp.]|jgi:D-tyrosyl-tRNA(Tyr) deacylase